MDSEEGEVEAVEVEDLVVAVEVVGLYVEMRADMVEAVDTVEAGADAWARLEVAQEVSA